MYAMCAGRAAFDAESAVGILRLVADKPARSLREVSPQTPGWLIAIVEKLMAKSPVERFASAAEAAELLGRHVHDLRAGPSATERAASYRLRSIHRNTPLYGSSGALELPLIYGSWKRMRMSSRGFSTGACVELW